MTETQTEPQEQTEQQAQPRQWTEADEREAEAAIRRAIAWALSPAGTAYGVEEPEP